MCRWKTGCQSDFHKSLNCQAEHGEGEERLTVRRGTGLNFIIAGPRIDNLEVTPAVDFRIVSRRALDAETQLEATEKRLAEAEEENERNHADADRYLTKLEAAETHSDKLKGIIEGALDDLERIENFLHEWQPSLGASTEIAAANQCHDLAGSTLDSLRTALKEGE
jgi:hypothetical protein